MIFIGYHPAIDTEKSIQFVETKEQIINSKSGSLIITNFNINDLDFYANLTISLAVFVTNIDEFLIASATKIKYAICDLTLAKSLQQIADNYLLDIKVLAKVTKNEISAVASQQIDGVFIVNQ